MFGIIPVSRKMTENLVCSVSGAYLRFSSIPEAVVGSLAYDDDDDWKLPSVVY